MRKFGIQAPEPRQTFSHARTKPTGRGEEETTNDFAVPKLGTKMRLVRKSNELTAACPQCERK